MAPPQPAPGRRPLCRSAAASERPRQTEDVLPYVREDEVGGDGRYLEEPGLAELPLDVVLCVEAVAAKGLHRRVRRLPGSAGREQQGHVGFGAAGLAPLEQLCGPEAHQVCSLHVYVGLCQRELDALVLSNRTAEDDALIGTAGSLIHEPPSVTDALCGYEDTFGIHAVEYVAKAFAFFANQAARRDAQVLEEELVGLVVDHHAPGLHRQPVANSFAQIYEEHGEPF